MTQASRSKLRFQIFHQHYLKERRSIQDSRNMIRFEKNLAIEPEHRRRKVLLGVRITTSKNLRS